MLADGRDRLLDAGHAGNVDYVLCDAEALPFAAASFHCVTIGFGLRNVTDKDRRSRECPRAQARRPAARARILEGRLGRSRRSTSLLDQVLPRLGALLANDAASYRYLAESIRRIPTRRR